MTVVPFQPRRDDGKPEWQLIYEVLADADGWPPGEVLRLTALDEILDRDFRSNRSPIYRAMAELERTHQRTLRAIPGVGYEVIEGPDQVILAQGQVHKAHRRIRRGSVLATTTNRQALNHEQARRLDAVQALTDRLDMETRRLDAKVAAQEKLLDQIRKGKAEDQ